MQIPVWSFVRMDRIGLLKQLPQHQLGMFKFIVEIKV